MFIQEGPVQFCVDFENKQKSKFLQRYLFLFNDILLVTKPKSERFKLKTDIPISLKTVEFANLVDTDSKFIN